MTMVRKRLLCVIPAKAGIQDKVILLILNKKEVIMDKEVLLMLINKVPSWFIMMGISLYGFNRACGKHIHVIIRLIAKHNAREDKMDRIQNEKIEMILRELSSLRSQLKIKN
jgi:hypothetical protein